MSAMEDPNLNPFPPPPQESPRQRTLLYVEDNLANMDLVKQLILRRGELKFLTAIDGDLGMLMARTYVPAVILMDINLPGKSGFEVLKLLREDSLTAHIPVIALSSNAYQRDIEMGLKAGFLRYITKPYKLDELLDALDAALSFIPKSQHVK
jgi:CheY-like chemotaxis protein